MNSNDRLKASRMLAVWLLMWMIPALDAQGVGRSIYGATYDPSNTLQAFEREHIWDRYVVAPEPKFNGPAAVSADFLRHPLSKKETRELERIQSISGVGDHTQAITELYTALEKYPKAEPYIRNLMGVEFIYIGNYVAAKGAFEQVLSYMPHLSANHTNLGLSLAVLGQNDQAQKALRTALTLDDHNQKARAILQAVRENAGR